MEYELITGQLSVNDFLRLRKSDGWRVPPENQVEAGLKNSLFSVTAVCEGQVIGMGRLVGDGFTICYVQDLIVLPEFQGKGIGRAILERLIAHVRENALPGTSVTIGLFPKKGKETFYEKFGFIVRPTEKMGAGMVMDVKRKE